jgi:Putative transposase
MRWFVYCKRPFAGPKAVLAYLSRYTHRVAISNSRLIGADENGVTFRVKDYRIDGPDRYKTMTLAPAEFIRRFMLHVLPKGFHRIRHYGLLARGAAKAQTLARVGELIAAARPQEPLTPKQQDTNNSASSADKPIHPCPCCGGRMIIIETFEADTTPRYCQTAPAIVDTS